MAAMLNHRSPSCKRAAIRGRDTGTWSTVAGTGRRAAKTSRHTLRHFISCRPSFETFRQDLEASINKARIFLGGRGGAEDAEKSDLDLISLGTYSPQLAAFF